MNLESYILVLIVTRKIVLWKPCCLEAGYILYKKEKSEILNSLRWLLLPDLLMQKVTVKG